MDWARPRRPWLARDVMREASGCMVEDPTPTRKTATSTAGSDMAKANKAIPKDVKTMPRGRLPTKGRRSNARPTTGWNTEAAI